MISSATIKTIQEKLVSKGVTRSSQLEELVDHYLTSLEFKINDGADSNQALLTTLQEIDNANHKGYSHTSKKYFILIALFGILAFSGIYFFADANNLQSQIDIKSKEKTVVPETWPVAATSKIVSSGFGPRKHRLLKKIKNHSGIDIKASTGTPVLASSEGIIMDAGYNKRRGNYIVIQHNDTYGTRYMHLKEVSVQSCDLVRTGERIGTVGSTGLSTAPHLHFEILENGKAVNPMQYLRP